MTFFGISDDAIATLSVGVVAALFGLMQWALSQRARNAERDEAMFEWGGQVIDAMAHVETLSWNGASAYAPPAFEQQRLDYLARTSALVDKGRMFFPNLQTRLLDLSQMGKPDAFRGHRVVILDKVLVAHVACRILDAGKAEQNRRLAAQVREARREFVSLLQTEVGSTRRRSSKARRPGRPVRLEVEDQAG